MQVISKSELLQTLKEIECQMYRSRIDGVGAVSWFSDIVNEQPVLDAVPVVHARWIKAECSEKDGNARCSKCGQWEWDNCNYCPNCGAKMDLEDK